MIITLKNLHRATKQQIADQVIQHMLDQGVKAEDTNVCRYRAGDLKCAAGCLIADSEYNDSWDEQGILWGTLVLEGYVPARNQEFISELQSIHDGCEPSKWEAELIPLCRVHNLDFNYVAKF